MALDRINATALLDGGVTTADIADDAVTTAKLATQTGNVDFADNGKIRLGDSQDLQIYHDGINSYIDDAGTGGLFIRGSELLLQKYTGEAMIYAVADGAVNLYHDNSTKISTTAYGAQITGSVVADTQTTTLGAGTYTPNMSSFQNFVWTISGNITLGNITTEKVGQVGFFVFVQDGTGSRTLSLGSEYKTAGAAGITLSTTANAVDIVPYVVQASGSILLGAPQLEFA